MPLHKAAFQIPTSPLRRARRPAPRSICRLSAAAPGPSSALDDIAPAVKLNAVAEALARKRDYAGSLRMLQEMNAAGVSLDRAALRAIVDAAVPDPASLAQLLRTAAPPGFASSHLEDTRSAAPHAPVDPQRPADLSFAAAFLGVVGTAVSAELVEPAIVHHPAHEATSVLMLVFAGLLFDRYAAAASGWRRISAGMARLFADDPVRAARVDAAHFLIAYLLGLPWVCFRPDPHQIVRSHKTHLGDQVADTPAMDADAVDGYLVWLVAGAAVEDDMDGMLIESDLRGARALLRSVKDVGGKAAAGLSAPSRQSAEGRIRSAISQAKDIVKRHERLHLDIADRMLQGASVGDCVAVVAGEFGRRRTVPSSVGEVSND